MKKLFRKIMDKIEVYFFNRAYIVFTPAPRIAYSRLNWQKHFNQVFISYAELRRAQNYSDPIKAALRTISHKIGEELLKDGFLVIESGENLNRGGIDINVIGYFSKPEEKTETVQIICGKIKRVLNWL